MMVTVFFFTDFRHIFIYSIVMLQLRQLYFCTLFASL